jgi:uncharacterized SAM-binding protein YcdF (DUF218 family)
VYYDAVGLGRVLLDPSMWIVSAVVLAFLLVWRNHFRAAQWTLGLTALIWWGLTQSTLPGTIARPLEQAYAPLVKLPPHVDGIVVLAGAQYSDLTAVYGQPQFNEEAERVMELIALGYIYPHARLVYSGGSTPGRRHLMSEAEVVRRFLRRQRFDPSRLTFEEQSANTYENAVRTYALLQPKPGETWLLVTSAIHMPRAMGSFAKAGWHIIPYPVSYRVGPKPGGPAEANYETLRAAIHEWTGIAVYRMLDRM